MTAQTPFQSVGGGAPNELPVTEKIRHWYRKLPDKKRYIEFITAALTVPVLLTVLISNVASLTDKNKTPVPTQPVSVQPSSTVVVQYPTSAPAALGATNTTPSPSPTPEGQCKPAIGPITVTDPQENDSVTGDPVCLTIAGTGAPYCAVVWSYRINSGTWSSYTGNAICMYGLSPGNKTLDLKVKSVVTGEETIITRHFTVTGNSATPTPATSSASVQ